MILQVTGTKYNILYITVLQLMSYFWTMQVKVTIWIRGEQETIYWNTTDQKSVDQIRLELETAYILPKKPHIRTPIFLLLLNNINFYREKHVALLYHLYPQESSFPGPFTVSFWDPLFPLWKGSEVCKYWLLSGQLLGIPPQWRQGVNFFLTRNQALF